MIIFESGKLDSADNNEWTREQASALGNRYLVESECLFQKFCNGHSEF